MRYRLIAVAVAGGLIAASAWAQMGPGMAPGMMGGYGAQGMHPGATGQGMGPGMMNQGMMGPGMGGPGMMGPGMMGPGMMGPGMAGPGMMGQGMMGGYGSYANASLTDEQRAKIAEIQQEVSHKHWDLMAKMHEQGYRMQELDVTGKSDDTAARNAYEAMSASHKQMFETMLDARKRINAVLTQEQREQMRRGGYGR